MKPFFYMILTIKSRVRIRVDVGQVSSCIRIVHKQGDVASTAPKPPLTSIADDAC